MHAADRTESVLDAAPDEAELRGVIESAARGDDLAWAELIKLYGRRVFALAHSRVRRADLAEEITQSVFATIAIKLKDGGYAEQGRFEPWLFRIAMNRVRDECRREQRQATPTDPESFRFRAEGDTPTPGDRETDRHELGLLRTALAKLADADREIIELRHHAQMSFKQIAELLDEPMGTLLARHHRALRKLRTIMEPETGGAS
ncbi:MAG: sigma-70 family RNA polymerase sigma factor [Phycisphaerales bacterium]